MTANSQAPRFEAVRLSRWHSVKLASSSSEKWSVRSNVAAARCSSTIKSAGRAKISLFLRFPCGVYGVHATTLFCQQRFLNLHRRPSLPHLEHFFLPRVHSVLLEAEIRGNYQFSAVRRPATSTLEMTALCPVGHDLKTAPKHAQITQNTNIMRNRDCRRIPPWVHYLPPACAGHDLSLIVLPANLNPAWPAC